MSLKDMLDCVKNNDLECLKNIMEDDDTYLTNKVCTRLLIESLERHHVAISNYILKYKFDLDAELFDAYIEANRPFTEKELNNLNRILEKFFICCLVNS